MKDKGKKVSAIIAAVNAYLEEEAAALASIDRKPVTAVSLWQASGRQEIMQMRSLWQRRIVPR